MKKNIFKFVNIALVLTLLFSVSSCEWVDPDINVNPDTPTDVPMDFILPTIQANMAYDIGGNDIVRPTNMWMQYFNGFARQSLTNGRYIYTPSDVNNVWNSLYWGVLMDLKQLQEKAETTNSVHFLGVGQVLNAITLMALTDLYGDIPWSEALQGGTNLSPALDSQEAIYGEVIQMLDDAIANLSAENEGSPLRGDLIYGNDEEMWIGAAYAVKARALLVLSKRNATAYADVLAVLAQGGITSSANNMVLFFEDASGAGHPIWQFIVERNDINMGETFVDLLVASNDPRLNHYADSLSDGTYVGGAPGSEAQAGVSTLGAYVNTDDAGVWFMTYAELKFIEAEALLPTDAPGAYAAYLEAIEASLAQVGVANASTWETTYPAFFGSVSVADPANLTLERIITQKYVALYGTMYAYNDWRRTGFPNILVAPLEAAIPTTPRRYPYGQSEITYNSNVDPVAITERVWWDAQ